ncbi:unnamed protein product [Caenorhabditis brenneri]
MEANDQSFDDSAQENCNPSLCFAQSALEAFSELTDKPLVKKTLKLSAPMADEVLGRVKQTQSAVYQLGKDNKAASELLKEELQVLRKGSGILAARSGQSDALVRELCKRTRYLFEKAHVMEIAHANQLSEAQALSKQLLHRDKPLETRLSLVARWGPTKLVAARFAARLIHNSSVSLASFELHDVYARRIRSSISIPKNQEAERQWTSVKLDINQAMSQWISGRERSIEISSHKPYHTVYVDLNCPCINSLTSVEAVHSDPLDCKTRRLAQEIMIALQYHLQSTSFEKLETLKINYIPSESTL